MEKAKGVGIWIRVSTEDQAKGESPEHHERRARFYAESKGWEVKEVLFNRTIEMNLDKTLLVSFTPPKAEDGY